MMANTELIEAGVAKYREALESGMSSEEAKQYAYSEVPGLKTTNMGINTYWANAIQKVKRDMNLIAEKSVNKNGTPPTKTPIVSSIAEFSRYMFNQWATRTNPKVNDVFRFSVYQWQDAYRLITGKEVTEDSLFFDFWPSSKGQLRKDGWEFVDETKNIPGFKRKDWEHCALRIVKVPAPEKDSRDIELEALKAQAAALMAKINELSK